jgi:hypothetical protein
VNVVMNLWVPQNMGNLSQQLSASQDWFCYMVLVTYINMIQLTSTTNKVKKWEF